MGTTSLESRNESSPRPATPRLRVLLAIAGIALLVMFLLFTRTGEFYNLEAAARDFQARVQAPRRSDQVAVVRITEDDYRELFGSTSPLDPQSVRLVLAAIAAGHPRLIGVDLETAHESFRNLRIPPEWPPIVWARDAIGCANQAQPASDGLQCRENELIPLGILGGESRSARSGLAVAELDRKGTVRHYRRFRRTTEGLLPSFASALRDAYAASEPSARDSLRPLFIDYRRAADSLLRFSAGRILDLATDSAADYRGEKGILTGRIVLLGGAYRAARDAHHTPLGMMPGVEIHAQILETELEGGGRPEPALVWLGVLQLLTATVLLVLFLHFPPRRAAWVGLLVFLALAFAGSLLVTGSLFAGLPYFVPLFVLVVIKQLYSKANRYREALVAELYRQARGLPPPKESSLPLEVLKELEKRLTGSAGRATRFGRKVMGWVARHMKQPKTPSQEPPPKPPSSGC